MQHFPEIIQFAIRFTTFALMFGVGLDCTKSDATYGVARAPLLATVTLIQFALIPGVALAVSLLLGLPPATSTALLLFSICPSGTVSNTFSFIAKANTSLSVLLTAASCIAAMVFTPVAMACWSKAFGTQLTTSFTIPLPLLLRQLIPLMAVPVALGALIRHYAPAFTRRNLHRARITSIILFSSMIALIILNHPRDIILRLRELFPAAVILTTSLVALGWLVAKSFRLRRPERTAVMFELPCRNLAIAALLGFTVLQKPDLVIYCTAFFLVEGPILSAFALFTARLSPDRD